MIKDNKICFPYIFAICYLRHLSACITDDKCRLIYRAADTQAFRMKVMLATVIIHIKRSHIFFLQIQYSRISEIFFILACRLLDLYPILWVGNGNKTFKRQMNYKSFYLSGRIYFPQEYRSQKL